MIFTHAGKRYKVGRRGRLFLWLENDWHGEGGCWYVAHVMPLSSGDSAP